MFSVSSTTPPRLKSQRSFRHKASASVQFYTKQLLDNWNIFFQSWKEKENLTHAYEVLNCVETVKRGAGNRTVDVSVTCAVTTCLRQRLLSDIRPKSVIDWLLVIHQGQKKKLQPWIKEFKSSNIRFCWLWSAVCGSGRVGFISIWCELASLASDELCRTKRLCLSQSHESLFQFL